MTTISDEPSHWAQLLRKFFLGLPEFRLERHLDEEATLRYKEVNPSSPTELMHLLYWRMISASDPLFLRAFPPFSRQVADRFGKQCVPLIAPAIKLGIAQKKFSVWIRSVESTDSVTILKSEEKPDFFLNLTDEVLLKMVDDRFARFSTYLKLERKDRLILTGVIAAFIGFVGLMKWSVTRPYALSAVWVFIASCFIALLYGCLRTRSARYKTGLFFIDTADKFRWLLITVPIWLVTWPFVRSYQALRSRLTSAESRY